MDLSALTSSWGAQRRVRQPATGSGIINGVNGPGVQVTDRQVGAHVVEEGWPRLRDWAVCAELQLETDQLLIESPRVTALVSYGIGAANYNFEMDVPLTGMCVHVAAQWVAVQTMVYGPAILPPADIDISVSVAPGRPVRQLITMRHGYGSLARPGASLALRAPRGAVAAVVTTQQVFPAYACFDGEGRWLYQPKPTGPFDVLSDYVELAQPVTPTPTFRGIGQGVSVPSAANALDINAQGTGGYHYATWEVQQ